MMKACLCLLLVYKMTEAANLRSLDKAHGQGVMAYHHKDPAHFHPASLDGRIGESSSYDSGRKRMYCIKFAWYVTLFDFKHSLKVICTINECWFLNVRNIF